MRRLLSSALFLIPLLPVLRPGHAIPWTADMAALLSAQSGRPALSLLPLLFAEPGRAMPQAAAQARVDFFETWTRRFAAAYGGQARVRDGVRSDNGQSILDVHGLRITDPLAMETEVNQWPGVVTVGIFARHRASLCLLGTAQGVLTLRY